MILPSHSLHGVWGRDERTWELFDIRQHHCLGVHNDWQLHVLESLQCPLVILHALGSSCGNRTFHRGAEVVVHRLVETKTQN